ncbi:MAG: MotA/TolQ/ExbB proton channel family protein [Kiloniellales bacterium]|nr:MotA/TolQ/ExbB proton channel family protein [Kiloniellales bacterium]
MANVGSTRARNAVRRRPAPRGRTVSVRPAVDFATLLGALGSFALIGLAIYLGGAIGNFLNLPGLLIVIGGTFMVTTISFTFEEVMRAQLVMLRALVYHAERPERAALLVIEMAENARGKGLMSLQSRLAGMPPGLFLKRALSLVIDGLPAEEIERILAIEAEQTAERHWRAAGVLRRAGEVAPAMGLIGTLVGLVQMLGSLEDPSTIGPAMAVALLTTFYGAVLANMVFNPLANKLERNSQVEAEANRIYALGAASISRQENPRRLEIALNTLLPPAARLKYFD